MNKNEKFEVAKKKLLEENESKYGTEIREKYGDDSVDASNSKLMELNTEQYERAQQLSDQINEQLKAACKQGNPSSELAQQVCALHKEWLGFFWRNYSKEAHLGLAQMYVDDPRFKVYYNAIGTGCAEFLRDALIIYLK